MTPRINKGWFKKGHGALYKGHPIFIECYCGKSFRTYQSKLKQGKGKYCSRVCSEMVTTPLLVKHGGVRFQKGHVSPNKKGYCYTRPRIGGKMYKLIHSPDHPNRDRHGYVREHRLVMEKLLGRYLSANEIVHHIDGDTLNNDVHNLELMSVKDHCRLHVKDNVHRRWLEKSPLVSTANKTHA